MECDTPDTTSDKSCVTETLQRWQEFVIQRQPSDLRASQSNVLLIDNEQLKILNERSKMQCCSPFNNNTDDHRSAPIF